MSQQKEPESTIYTSSPAPKKEPTKYQPLYYPPGQVYYNNFSLYKVQLVIQLYPNQSLNFLPSTLLYQNTSTSPLLKPSTSPTTYPSQEPINNKLMMTSTVPPVETSKDLITVTSCVPSEIPSRAPSNMPIPFSSDNPISLPTFVPISSTYRYPSQSHSNKP